MIEKTNQRVVILLTIDCLRYDHLKSSNYHRNTAPNIENFIKKGTSLSQAIVNGPETASSFSSIFTSILSYLNGGFSPLPNQKLIFPQILNENNVFSYGIHSNPNLGKYFNYHRGFNIFIDNFTNDLNPEKIDNGNRKRPSLKTNFLKKIQEIIWKKVVEDLLTKISNKINFVDDIRSWLSNFNIVQERIMEINQKGFTASHITKKIIEFLKYYKSSKSLFIWGHFMDVHWPYNPLPRNLIRVANYNISNKERSFLLNKIFWSYNVPGHYRENKPAPKLSINYLKKIVDLYDGAINYVDENLTRLFQFLIKKYKKDCLVIITSDHGEAFYEHEYLNHGGQAFEELLRVPIYIVELGNEPKINKIEDQVQLLDIAPTILDYFQIGVPDYFKGITLLPLIHGKKIPREDFVITESYKKVGRFRRSSKLGDKILSIRTNNLKYIFDEELKKEYLFDLKEDTQENNDLINSNTADLEQLKNIRDKHLSEIKQ